MTIRRHLTAIFGLFWIGGCALALMFQTRLMFHLPVSPSWLDGFVFGNTVFGYHFAHRQEGYRAAAWLLGGLGGLCFFWLDRTTQFIANLPFAILPFYLLSFTVQFAALHCIFGPTFFRSPCFGFCLVLFCTSCCCIPNGH